MRKLGLKELSDLPKVTELRHNWRNKHKSRWILVCHTELNCLLSSPYTGSRSLNSEPFILVEMPTLLEGTLPTEPYNACPERYIWAPLIEGRQISFISFANSNCAREANWNSVLRMIWAQCFCLLGMSVVTDYWVLRKAWWNHAVKYPFISRSHFLDKVSWGRERGQCLCLISGTTKNTTWAPDS